MSTATVPTPTLPSAPTRPLDAYERWVQARATQRSLNPYELLGLASFESNQVKLRSAIERQQQVVEGYGVHAAPELWQSFQREFQEATAVLTNAERKGLLDAALRRAQPTSESPLEGGTDTASNSAKGNGTRSANSSVECAKCHHANLADRKFCSSCGASLWETCPKCRAARLAVERFCGNCGLDVVEYFATQAAHFEEQLTLARRLQADAQFVDARRIVRELARSDDPRFDAQARLAAQLLDQFATGQKQQEASAETAVESAKRLVQEHAYETAITALQEVPEPLQSEEFKRVRAEALERLREAEQLIAAIREGRERKQSLPLLPLIERFLTLKPKHPQATKLASQIADQVLAQASKLSDERNWDGALDLLRAVPEFVVTDAMRRIVDDCGERSWLLSEIRKATVLHPSLPGLADRLVELCPGQDEFVLLARQLRERQAAPPRQVWQAVPDWATVPKRSTLDVPVDWWGGFQRFILADGVSLPTPRPALGRLCVAAGLALQALGKAPLELNLTEVAKTSMLGRLAGGLRRKAPTIAWGIDLSRSSLKAVRLHWDETARQPVIEACEFLERDSQAEEAREAAGDSWCEDALRQFLSRHDLSGTKVAVNLPSQHCLARFCTVPGVKGKKFDELVRYEARQQFPIALDDLVWEFVDLRQTAGSNDSDESASARVMLLASKRSVVATRLALFEQVAIKPDIVQCDAIALHNFLQFDLRTPSDDDEPSAPGQTIAALDIGAESSSFLISGRGFAWFRTFATGGDEFTKTLVRDFKLVRRQAEQAKRTPHRVRKIARMAASWEPIFNQLRNECQRSLEQWKTLDPSMPPERLIGTGGGSQAYGLFDALRGG